MASKTNYKSKYWMATEGIIQDQYVSLTCLWLIINSLNFSQFFRLVVIMHTAVQIRDMHPYYCKPKDMWKYLFTLWKSYMNYTHKIQTGVKEKKTDAIRLEPISTSSLHPSFPLPLFGYLHCQIYRVSFVVFKKTFLHIVSTYLVSSHKNVICNIWWLTTMTMAVLTWSSPNT